MDVGVDNRLVVEQSDGLAFRFVASPNTLPGNLKPDTLLLHATESADLQSAVTGLTDPASGASAHLVLGKDGVELVQLVDFDVRAHHGGEYDASSFGLELDYAGPLSEDESAREAFNHVSKFQPDEILYAVALNDRDQTPARLRPWPRYPKEQMDALLRVASFLVEHFDLEIIAHEEVDSAKFDPGPAFPLLKLKDILSGRAGGSVVFDETAQDLELRSGPGMVYPPLPGGALAAGTLVAVTGDHDGWALVEVMAEAEDDPWLVGWTPLDSIVARRATPVVKNHRLFTADGRQYQYVTPAAKNFDADRKLIEPRYLVVHTTGGIVMESTINYFRDPKAGVSAHLLIGRDGGVVQFVDFDTIAFHCGFSYWEGDSMLNRYAIGMEIDNGDLLSHADGVWKWKTTIIPDDEEEDAQHWKLNAKTGWHKFTQVQLEVATEIAQVLQKKYGFQVILGHDVINLPQRSDPGPLFPMEEFRQAVLGQPGVQITVYHSLKDLDIYKNPEQKPPDLDHPKYEGLMPAKTLVAVQEVTDDWTLVKVTAESGPFKKTTGWIVSDAVNPASNNPRTSKDSDYFKLNPHNLAQAPYTRLRKSPLPAGTRLRIETTVDDWALIVTLGPVKGQNYMEGWVEKAGIEQVGVERMPYPPIMP